MNSIKVLHTGDVHLGYDFGSAYDVNESFVSNGIHGSANNRVQEIKDTFRKIIDICRDEKADIMLIAGDLFDNENPSGELVTWVAEEFNRISEVMIMISPGNHDYYIPGGCYDKINTLCENVFIFDGEMDFYEFNIRNMVIRIYGAAFTDKVCMDTLMKQRIMPRDMGVNLGVFHGTIEGTESKHPYNPMSIKQIERNGFDYLALGHIHKQTEVLHAGMTNYAYCGCPEGMSFGTQGVKGVYLGMVGNGYADMRYVPVCRRRYEELDIDMTDKDSNYIQTAALIERKLMEEYGEDYRENLYRVNICGAPDDKININAVKRELYDLYYVEINDKTILEVIMGNPKKVSKEVIGEMSGENPGKIAGEKEAELSKSFAIKSIHIGNFGGLKNFTMEFNSGFNLIYGPNEFGKSTIMAFIKMMLYGCTSKSKDISLNLRKKYQPFDKSLMCGNIRFILNGEEYLAEKEFGKSPAFDIRHVYKAASGREIIFPKEYEVGDYFLGINEEEFDKTMFAADGRNYGNGDMGNGLLQKITNLSAGLDEDEDCIKDLEDLDKKIEKLKSKRGTSGEIPELNRQIDEFADELNRLNEEKSNLEAQHREDNAMEKRERRILSDVIDKMELLNDEDVRNNERNRKDEINRNSRNQEIYGGAGRKYRASLLLTFVCLGLTAASMICLKGKAYGNVVSGVMGILVLIFIFKAIMNKLSVRKELLSKNISYDEKVQERIDVILEELGYNGYSVRELKKELKDIDRHLEQGTGDVTEKISLRIRKCEYRLSELRERKSELGRIYGELLEKREELLKHMEALKDIVSTPLNKRMVELMNAMSGKSYESFILGENYSLKVKMRGDSNYHEWKHLSAATVMQAYLSLRISICELLRDNELTMPIMLDDLLSVCDDERTARSIKVLEGLETQVILFTCHRLEMQ